jgi:hypothetical protein
MENTLVFIENLIKNPSPSLYVILTCSACLEYFLNDLLLNYAYGHWGPNDYHATARALLSMHLKKKLDIVVPLLSNHEYRINYAHYTYKRLIALIKARNTITHNKPEAAELEYDQHYDGDKFIGFSVDTDRWDNLLKHSPDHFKYSECQTYQKALLDFVKRIFAAHYSLKGQPYQFRESKLICRNRQKDTHKRDG